MKIILQIEHLTKDFENDGRPAYKAVDDVSFTLNCGEKLAIIGESGSGKTTVVNMITRLIDVTKGKIILDGEDITNLTGKKLREAYYADSIHQLDFYHGSYYLLCYQLYGGYDGAGLFNKYRYLR